MEAPAGAVEVEVASGTGEGVRVGRGVRVSVGVKVAVGMRVAVGEGRVVEVAVAVGSGMAVVTVTLPQAASAVASKAVLSQAVMHRNDFMALRPPSMLQCAACASAWHDPCWKVK